MTGGDLRIRVRHLETEVARLQAKLCAAGIEYEDAPPWTDGLTARQVALVTVLLEAYPRAVDRYQLEETSRVCDHVIERSPATSAVTVCHLRKKFGPEAIESVWGKGYRLSKAFAAKLKAKA